MKNNSALYWVIAVSVCAISVFVYLMVGDAPKTLPKIKLSYFQNEKEISDSVTKRLFQEINQNSYYWIGVEPEKPEQLDVALDMADFLNQKYNFKEVILDHELALTDEMKQQFKVTQVISLKNDLFKLADLLQNLEANKQPYLVITASIYSTSLLPQNPIFKIKEKVQIQPMTFSFAYMAMDIEDEKNMLFRCSTEDHDGTANWGCVTVNKARSVRRKADLSINKPWIGLMDQSSERDYILLLKKKI